jgi:hypothetical protein
VETLNKLLNRRFRLLMIMCILDIVVSAPFMLIAELWLGGRDAEYMIKIFGVILVVGILGLIVTIRKITGKKDYKRILGVSNEELADIIEDINHLKLQSKHLLLGERYAFFSVPQRTEKYVHRYEEFGNVYRRFLLSFMAAGSARFVFCSTSDVALEQEVLVRRKDVPQIEEFLSTKLQNGTIQKI